MTVAVGVCTKDGVLLGADSASLSGWGVHMRADPKLVQLGDRFAVAATVSYRLLQIVAYQVEPPKALTGVTKHKCLARDWVPAVIAALDEHSYEPGEEEDELLVAWKDELFRVRGDFSVQQVTDRYDAIGAGEDYALGALDALNEKGCCTDDELLSRALATAARRCAAVRPPFVFAKTA